MTQSEGPTGAVSGREYVRTRPRGFVPWTPRAKSAVLLDQVQAVLEEYRKFLPMTARQIFYRLVGAHGYDKTELAYGRLLELLTRARRARLIPMSAIRDDRAQQMGGTFGYESPADFWEMVESMVEHYSRPLDEDQPRAVELWVEAAGMLPQISRVASEYGVACYGSGGFESVGAKFSAASRIAERSVPTTVLSVGDLDPSGLSIADAAAEDVAAFARQLGTDTALTVSRLAVTPEQVAAYRLETAPQKLTDRRGPAMAETVQAEALTPDELSRIVREGLEAAVDLDAIARVQARADEERAQLLVEFRRWRR